MCNLKGGRSKSIFAHIFLLLVALTLLAMGSTGIFKPWGSFSSVNKQDLGMSFGVVLGLNKTFSKQTFPAILVKIRPDDVIF